MQNDDLDDLVHHVVENGGEIDIEVKVEIPKLKLDESKIAYQFDRNDSACTRKLKSIY
jgi:hypothetical protein